MKLTYQTCCGVDVHKSFLVATIIKTTGGIEPYLPVACHEFCCCKRGIVSIVFYPYNYPSMLCRYYQFLFYVASFLPSAVEVL